MIADFIPLHKGTIAIILSFSKANRPAPKGKSSLAALLHDNQCIHVEYEELSEGTETIRCMELAHGWLCPKHEHGLLTPAGVSFRKPATLDKDAELISKIIAYEQRALAEGIKRRVNGLLLWEGRV